MGPLLGREGDGARTDTRTVGSCGSTRNNSTTIPVVPEGALDEGLWAYALRQAAIWQNLFTRFSTQWNSIPTFIRISSSALAEPGVQGRPSYLTPAPPIALL